LAFIRGASALTIVAGGNLGAPLTEVVVPLNVGDPLSYNFEADLVPDFSAGPILKHFVAGNIYRASQPWPQRIAEHFSVVNLTPALVPIENWHEEILTPGWEWYLPGAPGSDEWFPTGTILVTRDDQPWDSTVTPLANPQLLNVSFSPIGPGHVFGINKALLWVGDGDNTIWGDDLSELYVNVLEYPTPEPSSIALATIGLVGLAAYRLRRRKQERPRGLSS